MLKMKSLLSTAGMFTPMAFIAVLFSAPVLAADYEVKMLNVGVEGNMVFEPAVLEVSVGDTVTFVPQDMGHDSVSVFTPPGAATWHGRRGKKVSVTIDKEGVYLYKCAPHYYYGMFGVIYAGKLDNFEEARAVANKHSAKFVAHKERLSGYFELIEAKLAKY